MTRMIRMIRTILSAPRYRYRPFEYKTTSEQHMKMYAVLRGRGNGNGDLSMEAVNEAEDPVTG